MTMRRDCAIGLLAVTLAAGPVSAWASDQNTAQAQLTTVTVVSPTQAPVSKFLDVNGTVQASQTVNLMARASGELETVDFEPGSFVKKGALLFTIEQDRYQQEVNLNRAQLKRMQSEYDRQLRMIAENATSQTSVENYRAERDQALANTKLAEIDLSYTKITAPFDGRIGRNLVDPGNLVGYGEPTLLAVIQQLSPAYVYFNINERDLLQIREAMASRGMTPDEEIGKAPVMLGLQNETGFPHWGTLDFVDSTVSGQTGTLQARATVPNDDRLFLPGLFVRVRIPLGASHPGLLIPDRAIQSDQQGRYVLLVGDNDIVERQSVETGPLVNNLRAINSGLQASDRVITEGLTNVAPGQKVAPHSKNSASQ